MCWTLGRTIILTHDISLCFLLVSRYLNMEKIVICSWIIEYRRNEFLQIDVFIDFRSIYSFQSDSIDIIITPYIHCRENGKVTFNSYCVSGVLRYNFDFIELIIIEGPPDLCYIVRNLTTIKWLTSASNRQNRGPFSIVL